MACAAVSTQDRKLNSELKVKFQRLQETLAKENLSKVIDHLFAIGVISEEVEHQLRQMSNQREKSRELLSILRTSQHPLAFVKFQEAMMAEEAYKPILEQLDELKVAMAEPLSGTGAAISKHAYPELNDYIRGIFPKMLSDELHQLTDRLHDQLGVDDVEDLTLLEERHLTGIVKPIHSKKLLAAIATERIRQPVSTELLSSSATKPQNDASVQLQPTLHESSPKQKETTMNANELSEDQPKPKPKTSSGSILQQYRQLVPRVVHTLPQAEAVLGVTSLDDELFVLCNKDKEQVDVYNTTTTTTRELYSLVRRLSLPGVKGDDLWDMTSCKHYRCLYIADSNCCVHRVESNGDVTKLSVNNIPDRLSVTSQFTVLVTCCDDSKLLELTTEGKQLRVINLQSDIVRPLHAIQLSNGQFVVSHGYSDDPAHRVCIVDTNGHVTQSYGGPRGSATVGQLNVPYHLAVDKDEFIFVADTNNRRVLLLSPTLSFVREIVSRDQLKGERPGLLFLDVDRRCLYVAVGGRVVVVEL